MWADGASSDVPNIDQQGLQILQTGSVHSVKLGPEVILQIEDKPACRVCMQNSLHNLRKVLSAICASSTEKYEIYTL